MPGAAEQGTRCPASPQLQTSGVFKRVDTAEPEGKCGPAWHAEAMFGGEQEESTPEASREGYFGAAPAKVHPHACLTLPGSPLLLFQKTIIKSWGTQGKNHDCNVGDNHSWEKPIHHL